MVLNIPQELQKGIEDKYSRHNIRKIIVEGLKELGFKSIRKQAHKLIIEYLKESTYPSKNMRKKHLVNHSVTITQIIDEIIILTVPINNPQPIQAVAARLESILGFSNIYDGIKTASELLTVVCETDLYDIILAKDSPTGSILIESNFELSEETLDKISQTKYLPPMICEPKPITCNSDSGYITKKFESVILGRDNHHDYYQSLDILNMISKISLSLDRDVLELEEKPKFQIDSEEKMSNFMREIFASRKVYKELLNYGNMFYLNWRYDKRGRLYSQGYHVNIQGGDYKKALINFKKEEVITK